MLATYFMLRLLKSGDPRWWLGIGGAIGLGMMAKYTMVFFVAGIVAGVLLTDARQYLKSKWLWYGVALSLLIFLPNLIWQARHHFISLDFLQHIHARDVRIGRTKNFLPDQLQITLWGLPLALAGLYFYLRSRTGRRYRALGWMYLVPLVLFVIAKGRGYYLGAAYPMLYAAGSAWGEQRLASMRRSWAFTVRALAWTALVADIGFVAFITLPMAPVNSAAWNFASKINGDLREEIGWPELVETVAKIRDSLPTEERAHLASSAPTTAKREPSISTGQATAYPRQSAASIHSGSAAMANRLRKRSSSPGKHSASSNATSRHAGLQGILGIVMASVTKKRWTIPTSSCVTAHAQAGRISGTIFGITDSFAPKSSHAKRSLS